jgi:2-polyprenyl-3-methyl-5-hydroxy-6-metoxy-1,4-benzoquinol methylase
MSKRSGFSAFLKLTDDTDKSWREFGRREPYFGVFSAERFRAKNLDDAALGEFFSSGESHVTEILASARRIAPSMTNSSALDFGCGVGRLVLPLSSAFQSVTGVDISEDYIAEAKRNCERRGITNTDFSETVEALAARGRRYDLVHSSIVFNHIPWPRGKEIIAAMFGLLNPDGVMAIQILHRHKGGLLRRMGRWARRNFLPLNWLFNMARRRPIFEPLMQGNAYPLDTLLPLLAQLGGDHIHVRPEPQPGGASFAFVFCRKSR